MHRLLSARSLYSNGFYGYSIPSNNIVKASSVLESKCSFCQKILRDHGIQAKENLLQIRHQSTRTVNAVHQKSKKKVKYKNLKKYGEVLQVSDKTMTEEKVSISKLNAAYLSKLASSSVSLSQLHQLTTNSKNKPAIPALPVTVDPELLQSIKDKILNKSNPKNVKEVHLEDDQCALIFTSHKITNIQNTSTKQYLDLVKQSYYNFRKATLYDQKLNDIRYAINEGVDQEFDLAPTMPGGKYSVEEGSDFNKSHKGAHAVFRELFFDHHLDSYDQELVTHIASLQARGLSHMAMDDIAEEISHNEISDGQEDAVDLQPQVKTLKIKKAKMLAKKKANREKQRVLNEINMKTDMADIDRKGKQEALQKQLITHFQLLCQLGMLHEGRQILHHYRSRRHKEQYQICDIRVYNTLLQEYAAKGLYHTVEELLTCIDKDGVKMNTQTFATIFECIERSELKNKVDVLRIHHNKMLDKGFSLNDIMDKSKFLYDQREVVLKAIRIIEPDFVPVYTPPELDYVCPLLEGLKLSNEGGVRDGLRQSPAEGLLTLDELKAHAKKQLEIEIAGEIEVKNIDSKDDTSETTMRYREKLREMEKEWREVVKEAFIRNLSTLKSQSHASHSPITLYPYLKVLNVNQFVELIMSELSKLVDGSESYSPTLKLLQRDLGTQVYNRYQINQHSENGVLKKIEEQYNKYCEWYLNRHSPDGSDSPYNGRQAWQVLLHQNIAGASLDGEEMPWPMEVRQNIGKFLYNIIIHDVKIDVNMFKTKNAKPKRLPAVYRVHRPWARCVRLELKPHPVLARLWVAAARPVLRVRAPLLPLTCPARPWCDHRSGAYLLHVVPLVRIPFYISQQWKRLDEAPPATLYPVLDSLNQLGEVPWVINKTILDLQLQVFRSGGSKKLDIAQPPSALDTSQFGDAEDKASAFRRRVAVNRARSEMYSLWCDALYKLSLANHYRDQIFWLPHNMDFRGRVYACPPHLSQLGADTARALLRFASGRPLGARGLSWLKLHAVNLTGTVKKMTLDQRLEYADSVMDKILDSADRPLDGEMWWAQSEEPWQTLACCMEIANAVRSPNPEEYVCGFPVHQDGSCNGLQHYAALGGDAAGAAAVNLACLPAPQDVYSAVAAKVEEMRAQDAEAGVAAAQALAGFVRRKVIKQTVMTTVYGVTRFGARLQIAKQLKDIEEFPKEQVWPCSNYLTMRTFDSLQAMFTSTKLIQDWFTDCAKVISGVCGESVEWVTPLGLPVVQPYYKRSATAATSTRPLDSRQRPCTLKQKNAFPPNLIHSLDSSHMMLAGLWCQARGVTFVSVHDCFWTHPDTVHHMNKICREQFVALHSQPILNELSEDLVRRYSYTDSEIDGTSKANAAKKHVNELLRKVPPKGDFNIENVLRSVYFFS